MANTNPTPAELRTALLDWAVDVKFYDGWDRVGRSWKGPDGSPGLMGAVVHHTANPGAKPGGDTSGILYWATHAYDLPVCNLLQSKNPGETWLLSAGSVYHCGDGGPVPALGIPDRGYFGQTRLFGIETDDPGTSIGTITDYQIENVSKILASLVELCGWDIDKSILTHKCYTDGCHGANPNGPSPCVGRKNDTIDGPWGDWPGSDKPEPYNAPWWRQNVKNLSKKDTWDGTIPTRESATNAYEKKINNKAAWRLACRLYDVGVKNDPPMEMGKQQYPLAPMKRYQESIGIKPERQDGLPNKTTWIKLFGEDKP